MFPAAAAAMAGAVARTEDLDFTASRCMFSTLGVSTFGVSKDSALVIGSGWRIGSLTTAAGTAFSGVPSTGQKLNLSANSSWHVLQNFIFTTSLSLVGLNAKSDTEPPLLLC